MRTIRLSRKGKQMEKFLAYLVAIFLSIPSLIYRGFVLSLVWAWFVVPLGVPPVGIAHAIGVSGVYALIRGVKYERDDDRKGLEVAFGTLITSFMFTTLMWLTTYIIHLFM